MAKAKDRPLLLRKRDDGQTYLGDGSPGSARWPQRFEFTLDKLLQWTMSGTAKVSEEEIHLNLANAQAVYEITLRPGEVGSKGERTTGFWGRLKEGEVK